LMQADLKLRLGIGIGPISVCVPHGLAERCAVRENEA
jgi:hypothetical protein